MDKIRIGDTVKFSYNTTPRIYLIVNNRSDIGIMTQCVVEDIVDDTAVIHAQSDEEARLVIPTKYLIKVEAEAKEPKYKRGQWVEMPDGDVAVITNVDYKSSHPYSLFSVKKEDLSYDLWSDDDLKPYTEPTEQSKAKEEPCIGRINFAERVKRQQEAHQSIVNEIRDKSFDWDAYTADLAKEVVLKIAGSQLHNHQPQEISRMAVEIAKSVVENLKESEE